MSLKTMKFIMRSRLFLLTANYFGCNFSIKAKKRFSKKLKLPLFEEFFEYSELKCPNYIKLCGVIFFFTLWNIRCYCFQKIWRWRWFYQSDFVHVVIIHWHPFSSCVNKVSTLIRLIINDFEKKNPPSTHISTLHVYLFLRFSPLHSTFIALMY